MQCRCDNANRYRNSIDSRRSASARHRCCEEDISMSTSMQDTLRNFEAAHSNDSLEYFGGTWQSLKANARLIVSSVIRYSTGDGWVRTEVATRRMMNFDHDQLRVQSGPRGKQVVIARTWPPAWLSCTVLRHFVVSLPKNALYHGWSHVVMPISAAFIIFLVLSNAFIRIAWHIFSCILVDRAREDKKKKKRWSVAVIQRHRRLLSRWDEITTRSRIKRLATFRMLFRIIFERSL